MHVEMGKGGVLALFVQNKLLTTSISPTDQRYKSPAYEMATMNIAVALRHNIGVILNDLSLNRTVRELETLVLIKKGINRDGFQTVHFTYSGSSDRLVLLRPEMTIDGVVAAITEVIKWRNTGWPT